MTGVYLGGTSDALKHYVHKQLEITKECEWVSIDFGNTIHSFPSCDIVEESISVSYVNRITILYITTITDKYIIGIKDFIGII